MSFHQTRLTPSGYSGTPLIQKLGLKPGFRIKTINAPSNYFALIDHPADVVIDNHASRDLDFIHLFVRERSELESRLGKLKTQIKPSGMIWVSWPKGSANVETDINENSVREVALEQGLVDVKVAAIDGTWSGLKLVFRLKDRHG